jgi:hypothetical protein
MKRLLRAAAPTPEWCLPQQIMALPGQKWHQRNLIGDPERRFYDLM